MTPARRTLAGVAALALLALIAHGGSLDNGFIWDDDAYLTENPLVAGDTGWAAIWSSPAASPQYYPLVFTMFRVEHALFDGDDGSFRPGHYHAVNLLLHALTAVLLWRVLVRLRIPGAWLAAALFAVHPVHVESVAWITERKNVLSGVFYMAAALAWLTFAGFRGAPAAATDSTAARPKPVEATPPVAWHALIAAFFPFAAALLSKSVTASLPAALAVVVLWRRRRLLLREWVSLALMQAVGVASGLFTAGLERHSVGATGPEWAFSAADRVLIAGRALWFYVAKVVWPQPLIFIYPRWHVDAGVWWQWLFPVAAAGLMVALLAARRRIGTAPLAAALFFGGTLVPALGFFNIYPMRYSFVADHFQYLASIGLLALLSAAAATRLPARWRPGSGAGAGAGTVAAAAVLIVLGLMSRARSTTYRDAHTLWTRTVEQSPSCFIGENNLGEMLLQDARTIPDSEPHFLAALAAKPDYAEALSNLALAVAHGGDNAAALRHLDHALALEPGMAAAHVNRGYVLQRSGRAAEARAAFEAALVADPTMPQAHFNLAGSLIEAKDIAGGTREAEEAVRLRPRYPEAQKLLGNLRFREGDFGTAALHYAIAAATDPEDADAHAWLGAALARQGLRARAQTELETALRLKPDHADARHNLELLLRQ